MMTVDTIAERWKLEGSIKIEEVRFLLERAGAGSRLAEEMRVAAAAGDLPKGWVFAASCRYFAALPQRREIHPSEML